MIHSIHISVSVKKQEQLLNRSAIKGKNALMQYQFILREIQQGEVSSLPLLLKRTKKGEQRISNCVKYNLGSGFRLITIKNGRKLFITFLGSHDETNSWLEKNKGYSPDSDSSEFSTSLPQTIINQPEAPPKQSFGLETDYDDYEDKLHSKIDESILRTIFCGLFTPQKS